MPWTAGVLAGYWEVHISAIMVALVGAWAVVGDGCGRPGMTCGCPGCTGVVVTGVVILFLSAFCDARMAACCGVIPSLHVKQ